MHVRYRTLRLLLGNYINVQRLPLLPSHELHPLDVLVLSSFKQKLCAAFGMILIAHEFHKLDVFAVIEVVKHAYDSSLTRSNITSGFVKLGYGMIEFADVILILWTTSISQHHHLERVQNVYWRGVHLYHWVAFKLCATVIYHSLMAIFRRYKHSLLFIGTIEVNGTVTLAVAAVCC